MLVAPVVLEKARDSAPVPHAVELCPPLDGNGAPGQADGIGRDLVARRLAGIQILHRSGRLLPAQQDAGNRRHVHGGGPPARRGGIFPVSGSFVQVPDPVELVVPGQGAIRGGVGIGGVAPEHPYKLIGVVSKGWNADPDIGGSVGVPTLDFVREQGIPHGIGKPQVRTVRRAVVVGKPAPPFGEGHKHREVREGCAPGVAGKGDFCLVGVAGRVERVVVGKGQFDPAGTPVHEVLGDKRHSDGLVGFVGVEVVDGENLDLRGLPAPLQRNGSRQFPVVDPLRCRSGKGVLNPEFHALGAGGAGEGQDGGNGMRLRKVRGGCREGQRPGNEGFGGVGKHPRGGRGVAHRVAVVVDPVGLQPGNGLRQRTVRPRPHIHDMVPSVGGKPGIAFAPVQTDGMAGQCFRRDLPPKRRAGRRNTRRAPFVGDFCIRLPEGVHSPLVGTDEEHPPRNRQPGGAALHAVFPKLGTAGGGVGRHLAVPAGNERVAGLDQRVGGVAVDAPDGGGPVVPLGDELGVGEHIEHGTVGHDAVGLGIGGQEGLVGGPALDTHVAAVVVVADQVAVHGHQGVGTGIRPLPEGSLVVAVGAAEDARREASLHQVGQVVGQHNGTHRRGAAVHLVEFASRGGIERAEVGRAPTGQRGGEVRLSVHDGHARTNRPFRNHASIVSDQSEIGRWNWRIFPIKRSIGAVYAIDIAVVRAEIDRPAREGRREADGAVGHEDPLLPAGLAIQGIGRLGDGRAQENLVADDGDKRGVVEIAQGVERVVVAPGIPRGRAGPSGALRDGGSPAPGQDHPGKVQGFPRDAAAAVVVHVGWPVLRQGGQEQAEGCERE